jgi:hypothetical protein
MPVAFTLRVEDDQSHEALGMSIREISRAEFRQLAYSIINTLPASDAAWFASADDCLIAAAFHDVHRGEWEYKIYRRRWGVCELVAEADGFKGRPDAALVSQVKSLAETVYC